MKSVMLACQTLMSSHQPKFAMIAGGMESMSNIPHYLPNSRSGILLGHAKLLDGVIHDGLWDCYSDQHMGMCGEKCAQQYKFSREDQDAYALESYRRAVKAITNGLFEEIVSVHVPQRHGDPLVFNEDEEPSALVLDKFPSLRPAFDKNGTLTAANSS